MANNDWKSRLGVVYSTNPDFSFNEEDYEEVDTLQPNKQKLIVAIDKKGRAGKQMSAITGFVGKEEDLQQLVTLLKNECGVGVAVQDGVILIQGASRDKIVKLLLDMGYNAKRGN